ncbi:MAG: hypothetical protein MJZ88_05525 [Paludibacteraceae bacterium]|nr:hypothetical protein [Paludibacteraceae bacterium]
MKKIVSICLVFLGLLFGVTSNGYAQQRTKIADGYYVVNYGNVSVIEDDNRGMSIEIKVEKAGKNSYGEQLYNVLCENKTIKSVAIGGLSKAIQVALTSAGIPIPSWVTGPIVAYVYESVCDYYGNK